VQWDGFAEMERDVRAMVADPRWAALPVPGRVQAMAERRLGTPDGATWLFGANARWYRYDRSDGVWHLSPPPLDPRVRTATHPARQGPVIPPAVIPAGPDYAYDRGSTQAFVGPDVLSGVTDGVRALVAAHRGLRGGEFPLDGSPFRELFAKEVSSTVAAVWGTIVWCAYAPAFDGNEALLSVFGEFLARPLPGDDWVRWLPPGSLEPLASLYSERVRAGAPDAGARLTGLMADTATVLRADARFRPRADALLSIVGPVRTDGDVRRAWLARVPPHLAGATIAETSPGEHFRHAMYDLVEALAFVAARGADPRAVAASLLAADVSAVAPGVVAALYRWLDPQMRQAFYVALADQRHPLRGCWPRDGALPDGLMPPDRDTAAALLGTAYATGLAWSRLTGTEPPPRGFPASAAVVQCLIHQRDDPLPAPDQPGLDAPETTSSWPYHT
jgi:hypothetical protein